MSFGERLKRDFSTMTLVLIPVAIVINIVVGQIVAALKLPVFLDSIGTVLVAVLAGPWAGLVTGTLSNIIWSMILNPDAIYWTPVATIIGLIAGLCAKYGLFREWWKVIVTGVLVSLAAAVASAFISVWLYGGITASGISFVTIYLVESGRGLIESVFAASFIVEPIDKIITCLAAWGIIKGMSLRYVSRFPRAENVSA